MFGWRSRIGLIVSTPKAVVEGEFGQMAPEGVSVHAAKLGCPEGLAGARFVDLHSWRRFSIFRLPLRAVGGLSSRFTDRQGIEESELRNSAPRSMQ